MQKVLVTGGGGFIAGHLVRKLHERGVDVSYTHRNQFGTEFISAVGKHQEIAAWDWNYMEYDTVFHLAGNPRMSAGRWDLFGDNLKNTFQLVDKVKAGTNFVFASSSTVYGDSWLPHSEDERPDPQSFYGATKLSCEHIIQMAAKANGFTATILRLCATVGRGSKHGLIPDLIRKFKECETVELFGDSPGSVKPFLLVDDAVAAFIHAVGKPGIFNISPADNLSVDVVASNVQYKIQSYRPIKWLGDSVLVKGDTKFLLMDNRKAIGHGFNLDSCSYLAVDDAIDQILWVEKEDCK